MHLCALWTSLRKVVLPLPEAPMQTVSVMMVFAMRWGVFSKTKSKEDPEVVVEYCI